MFKLLRSYLFWTYERGSLHYDVMVTLILLFLFLSPHFIDYKEKPVGTIPLHDSEVLVKEAGMVGHSHQFLYQIRAGEMSNAQTDADRRAAILSVIEPIAGEVELQRYETIQDAHGNVIAYNAWVLR